MDDAMLRMALARRAQIDAEVLPLCEVYGFGAVMQSAAELWAERDPIGAPYCRAACA